MLHHSFVLRRWKQWLALPVGALLLTVAACEKTSYTGALPEPQTASATASAPIASPVSPVQKDTVFAYVQHMPEYPGGIPKLLADIVANTHYPSVAAEAGIEGKVFVGFIVEKDGTLSGVRLQHGMQEEGTQAAAAKALNDEALRVINTLPNRWTPGKQGNRLVKVSYVVPISFAKN
ncbi:energy transducer TonB [Hymenobacter sp. GOD-10R]|uniref:energy transducer TonB n=1 Tax=Hymenobacter sp. GOD-10R TaxID=3093922 RepID=UPI002D782057|nr:energy transducer TonB [Hymenobacter sp. GOD-10R]WRQ28197.1 energy transducer TonB [Hymenobacter sp. GOD-10R]